MRGILNVDSDFAKQIGFTSDKFRGYLWQDENRILIAAIWSIYPGRGYFTKLIKNIEVTGLKVAISTPLGAMSDYLAKRNFVPHWEYDIDLEKIEVWERSEAYLGVENQPKPKEVWQHFKGGKYQIMAVSNSVYVPCELPVSYWCRDTETLETLAVYHHDYGVTLTKEDGIEFIPTPHVLYFPPNDCSLVWARKLTNFLNIIEDGSAQYPRFERIIHHEQV